MENRMTWLTIAGRLTPAQRRALVALTDQPQLSRRGEFSPVAAFNMISMGLVKLGFDKHRMRDTYRLSAKGLAVRDAILKDRNAEPMARPPRP